MPEQAETIHLPPARVAELVESGEAELIDVRRDYEWDQSHIAGSRHIEVNELTAQADSIPRDRPVVFVCRSGNRSGMAADAFREAGYDAYHLDGGLTAWVDDGRPVEPEGAEVADIRPAS
jgi:rhodanese-related sulfurtransferase